MKISKLKIDFQNALSRFYPSEEIQSFFDILSEKYLNLSRIEIALNPDRHISETEAEKFQNAIHRLQNHEPIQYIIGETEFYGLPFKVNKHTLIPRPETEELVDWVLSDLKGLKEKLSRLAILDIGTGSGCIAVSLAKNLPNATVSALDISEEALKVARQNAKLNGVSVELFKDNILKLEPPSKRYDIIVSNPPYVLHSEKNQMKPNVLNYEPELALYAPPWDDLMYYIPIIGWAEAFLSDGGALYLEINEKKGNELLRLLAAAGLSKSELRNDIFGKSRMIKAQKEYRALYIPSGGPTNPTKEGFISIKDADEYILSQICDTCKKELEDNPNTITTCELEWYIQEKKVSLFDDEIEWENIPYNPNE
ncbi:peptide chain release factor N(5)-glutamine methyltransferase [Aequorivita todarodis]|uniref:peptide chain release factor N(5)-glutamine methyltransferase n=1 Tax=Aequorivita todarodis TaxID=2036821 RepID=UPI00234FF28C|nr:peptide chain release factor N(5)-glutamine methyltransferase [Aequorivita todarodis]MDC8000351.1 peptide chain release factor N(5)-glutamine methyltransferase [Aequorivita todarodis]